MKRDVLFTRLGIALAAIFLMGAAVIPAVAQNASTDPLFQRSTATITLTDTGITMNPQTLKPGPVTFTVVNQSSRARGVVINGVDRASTPIVRYSARIMPGKSTTVDFWMYQGETYTFRDFTARTIRGNKSTYSSTYTMQYTVPNQFPLGRGPQYVRRNGTIRITNNGIVMQPMTTTLGPIMFTVTNETNRSRGVFITGDDRSGSPIFRYSRVLRPGQSTRMSFWLYEGKTYRVQDYTRRITARGAPTYSSTFTSQITVSPSSPLSGTQ